MKKKVAQKEKTEELTEFIYNNQLVSMGKPNVKSLGGHQARLETIHPVIGTVELLTIEADGSTRSIKKEGEEHKGCKCLEVPGSTCHFSADDSYTVIYQTKWNRRISAYERVPAFEYLRKRFLASQSKAKKTKVGHG